MSIVDKIFVVEEYADALLQRLGDFKQALDNENLQPPAFRKLNQVQALPLNKGTELEPSAPNLLKCDTNKVARGDILEEFEPFTLLAIDVTETRKALLDVLKEIGAHYTKVKIEELKTRFLKLFNRYVKIHLFVDSFKQFQYIVLSHLTLYKVQNRKLYKGSNDIATLFKNLQDPFKMLSSDLNGVQGVCEEIIPGFVEANRNSKTLKFLSWEGPLGVYSGDGVIPALLPGSMDDEDAVQSNSPIKYLLQGREPVGEDEVFAFQILPEIRFFTTTAYLIFPELISTPQILEDIEQMLGDTIGIPLGNDEIFLPHGYYEQLFSNFKPKALVFDKNLPIKALETAVQQAPYNAALRRSVIAATGNQLFDFMCEDPAVHVPLCIDNALGLLGLCATELEWYFAHVYRTITTARKNQKLNGDEFEDSVTVAQLLDIFLRTHDLLMMHAHEVTAVYRYFLASRDTKAFRYALSEVRKVMDPASLPTLARCQELVSRAEDPSLSNLSSDTSGAPKSPSKWSMYMTVRLELLRIAFNLTQSSVRQPSAMNTLWPALSRVNRRLCFADPTDYANLIHNISCGCGSLFLRGNMHRVMKTMLVYIDSVELRLPLLTTLLRMPYTLSQLYSPLLSLVENTIANEAAYMWTKTFVYFLVRKVEELVTQLIIMRFSREQTSEMMGKVAELSLRPEKEKTEKGKAPPPTAADTGGFECVGADLQFPRRKNLGSLPQIQQRILTILAALTSLTGKPVKPSYIEGLTPASESSPYPSLFSFALVQHLQPDGIIYLGNNKINVKAAISVMFSRLLSRMFAHVCSLPLKDFTTRATSDLLAKLSKNLPVTPYTPGYAPFHRDAVQRWQARLQMTFTNYLRATSEALNQSAKPPYNPVQHIRDQTALSLLDYESEPANVWWNPPVKVNAETILTATTPANALKEKATAPAPIKEAETPVAPSIAFNSIMSIIQTSKLTLHLGFPLLQVDEIAQRVLLNMCTVPTLLPPGFCMKTTVPIGAWFYRLFGREKEDWFIDGSEAGPSGLNVAFENDAATTGYITMVYGRWYSDVLCSTLFNSADTPVIYSPQEAGFIRPPSTQSSASPQVVKLQQTVLSLTSASELRMLTELIGPFGVEAIATLLENCALPRHIAKFITFMTQNLSALHTLRETQQVDVAIALDNTLKVLKGREVDLSLTLMGIGSTLYFVELLRKSVQQLFSTRQQLTADTLRSIASLVQQVNPDCTLGAVTRIYALALPSADGQPPLPGVPAQATGAELYDAPFFAYIRHPSPEYMKYERVSFLPSIGLILLSSPTLWTNSIYLTGVGGFDTNLHTAARGLVYLMHCFGTPLEKLPDKDEPLEIAVRRLLAVESSKPATPQLLIFRLLDTACSLVVDSTWDEAHINALEHKVMFISTVFQDAPWIGTETLEHWLPNDLIKSAKLSLMRTG